MLQAANAITGIFRNRWRTLMAVDDVVAEVFSVCEEFGVVDNTYFFFTSDHGFQVR
jgi:N-acetylglucosamine-6-sulfatase